MTTLLLVNGLIVLLGISGSLFLLASHSRSMFSDIGIIFRFWVITMPVVAAVFNFIPLVVLYPEHIWYSLLPILVPVGVILWQHIQNSRGERVWTQFDSFSAELIREASLHGVALLSKDVRVRITEGKKMVYVLNAYSEDEEVALQAIEKDFVRITQQAFKNYDIQIYVDKKRT